MKFTKLTKKLLLSALSLGLAVVTLTTTTFAWYTTNTEVSAAAKGSTSGVSNDTSLLISADGNEYGPSVDLEQVAKDLLPVQWNATETKFQDKGGVESDDVIAITVYFKISQAIEKDTYIYLSNLTIKNTGSLDTYDNLASSNTIEGCPTGPYTVDAVNALDLVINNVAYDLTGEMNATAAANFNGTPDAIKYYNEVMGSDNAIREDGETANFETFDYETMAPVATIAAKGTTASVTVYLYLNGWDKYCFDACRGQDFDITLNFTTVKPGTEE